MDAASTPERHGPRIALVAALSRDRAIGRDNELPWHLPDDLRRFKALTLGHAVLMGRRTAQSIGRALPKRRNLVLSRAESVPIAGMERCASLDEVLARCSAEETLYVIGGGEIYAQTLAIADLLHLTWVDCTVPDADAWFPSFDAAQWREIARESHAADLRHAQAFAFVDLERIGR